MGSFQFPDVTVSFLQSTYSIIEGNTIPVCAELSSVADILVSVGLTISEGTAELSTDFTLSPSTQVLTFEPGAIQSCVSVAAMNDSILEVDEAFVLLLVSNDVSVLISSTDESTTIEIPNQNSKDFGFVYTSYIALCQICFHLYTDLVFSFAAVTVSFEVPSYSVQEGSSVQVCSQLSSEAAIPVTVALSISDGNAQLNTDYAISSLFLTFQPGNVLSCTNITAIADSLLEEDETLTLALESINNSVQTIGTTTVTIPNEDGIQH